MSHLIMWDTYIITDMLVVEESELNLIFIYQATLSWEIENICRSKLFNIQNQYTT